MANHLLRPKNEIMFGKIKMTLFLGKNVEFRCGKPPEMAVNSKIVIEINLGDGYLTLLRTMTGLPEDFKYLPGVVLPSARYSNVSGRNNKCVSVKVKNSGNFHWKAVSA